MNLASEITAVRNRVGEPSRVDEANSFMLDSEIRAWLFEGELNVCKDLPDDALYPLHTSAAINLAAGSESYDLPADFVRLIEVRVKIDGASFYSADLVSPKMFRQATNSPMWRSNSRNPRAMLFNNKIFISPPGESSVTGGVEIRYVKEPTRRYKHYKGTTTGSGSTTTVVDSLAPGVDNYWVGSELVLLDGGIRGESGVVTAFTDSSGTFTFAASTFTVAPGSSVDFEVGQISSLPSEFFPLWVAWASWLALSKDRETDLAMAQKTEYETAVAKIMSRYEGLHRSEPAREKPR